MKTKFTGTGKFKLVLFVTLCAVLIGCAIFLCFEIFNQNNNIAGAPEPTGQTEISAPEKEASATAVTGVTPPTISSSSYYTISGNTATATYTGNLKSMSLSGTSSSTMTVSGGNSAAGSSAPVVVGTDAGTYTLTVSLKDTTNYQWSDGTTAAKTYSLIINKATVELPTVSASSNCTVSGNTATATYNGNSKSMTLGGLDSSIVTVSGGNSAAGSSAPVVLGTNAGTYSLTLTLNDTKNYKWSDGTTAAKTYSLIINKVSISPSLSYGSLTYGGSAITPTLTGNTGGGTVTYSVAAGTGKATINSSTGALSPTQAGTVTVTASIAATTNYAAGTATATVTIGKKSISPTVSYGGVNYGTNSAAPTIGGNTGSGSVTYSVAAGTGSATINSSTGVLTPTGVGTVTVTATIAATTNYNSGTAKTTVTISKGNISPSLTYGTVTYGSTSGAPTLTGNTGGGTVTYSLVVGTGSATINSTTGALSPTKAGTVSVTVTIGATTNYYSGSKTVSVTINAASISPNLTYGTVTYGSASGAPTLTGNTGGGTVTYSVAAGTGSATINSSTGVLTPTGAGTVSVTASIAATTNYKAGSKTVTVTINTASISPNLTYGTVTYGSNSGAPTLTGNTGGGTVTYSVVAGTGAATINASTGVISPTKAGSVSVTVSIGATTNYKAGSKTVSVTINQYNLSNATIAAIAAQEYTGNAIEPAPAVTALGKTLAKDTDYTVTYSNNVNAGQATVTVTGTGNYTGTKTANFTISGTDISGATIGTISNYTYDGTEKKPTATVTFEGVALSSTTDFEYSYSNNINAGTATLIITGTGNYTGTITKEFTISARDIANATASTIPAQTYSGSEKTPVPTLTDLSKTLTNNTDYTLEYADNINVGTATITVTGNGNYTGTKTVTFAIAAKSISTVTVGDVENYFYDGAEKTPTPAVTDGEVTLAEGKDFSYSYRNNVNVGAATLIITGMGNYGGTKEISFLIEAPTVNNAEVTLSRTEYTYDGTPKTPSVTLVKVGDLTLVNGVDYTVSYSANVNAGTATVIITGAGDYSGRKEVEFTINPADLSTAAATGLQLEYTYTGVEIAPDITLTIGEKTLVKNTDYTITYENNLNVGTATVTVKGSRNYTGTWTDNFTIVRASISPATVTGVNLSYEYTGSAIEPTPVVNLDGLLLVKDRDYTVTYTDNKELGTATISLAGINNFNGAKTVNFEIGEADISGATVGGIDDEYDYTGSAIIPDVTVTLNDVALVSGTDFAVSFENNVNVGTATVTIEGRGNYKGTITRTFAIVEADFDDLEVSGVDEEYAYTGEEITPEIVLTYKGNVLKKDADYTIEYADNIELGTATITVTGMGNFDAVKTVTFEIVEADISKASITGVDRTYSYTGSAITPEPTVTLNGKTLEKGVDYTVSYRNNVNLGAAVVVVTGIGNYANDCEKAFMIVTADLSDATVEGVEEEYQWTGSEIELSALTVTLNEVVLVKDRDYTVTYTDNVEIGTASYKIEGTGNYEGSIDGEFAIVKATPNVNATTDWNGADKLFVGNALPDISATATYNGATVEGNIAWDEEDGSAPTLKENSNGYGWTFTPVDTEHYVAVKGTVTFKAEVPEYAGIYAEWKDKVQPELFTSSSVSVIKNNLKVTGILSSTETVVIAGGYTFEIVDGDGVIYTSKMPSKGGINFTIKVSFGTLTDTIYDVEITDVALIKFEVDDSEAVTEYTALDTFDTSSITVVAKFNDHTSKTLTCGKDGYSVIYEDGDSLQYGDGKVTVSYTYKGVTEKFEIEVEVAKKVFDGTLTLDPEDKDYDYGKPLTGGIAIEEKPDWLEVEYVYEVKGTDGKWTEIAAADVKNAGEYRVTANFTVDKNHEDIDSVSAEFDILKIKPTFTPAVGGSFVTGTALSELTLSAGSNAVAGTITWDNGDIRLEEGLYTYTYTFTPEDTVNYEVVKGSFDITATAPQASGGGIGGSLVGWQIALIVISIVVAIIAITALVLALRVRKVTVDSDGFYDDVTDEDLLK